jgi:hypothetical protein
VLVFHPLIEALRIVSPKEHNFPGFEDLVLQPIPRTSAEKKLNVEFSNDADLCVSNKLTFISASDLAFSGLRMKIQTIMKAKPSRPENAPSSRRYLFFGLDRN